MIIDRGPGHEDTLSIHLLNEVDEDPNTTKLGSSTLCVVFGQKCLNNVMQVKISIDAYADAMRQT
jgi:hypothetical protein